jgi:hypothetical protein
MNMLRRVLVAGYVAPMDEKMRAYRVLVGKPEGNETIKQTYT